MWHIENTDQATNWNINRYPKSCKNDTETAYHKTIQRVLQRLCKDSGYSALSESSLWRILDCCGTTQRKAMQGLDNYTADGLTGFDRLDKVVDELKIESSVKSALKGKLLGAKLFLKGQYKVNVKEESSKIICDHSH